MIEPSEKALKTWVLALTSVASLMVALDALVVTTALGTIRLDLGASIEALQWTMNAYNLSFAVLLLTGAALGDRFGRRRTHPTFNAAPQTALKEENKMAFPRGTRSIPVRSLNTVVAALALVFGSSLPLNAQPKAPEVTVANPVVKRIVQWDEYTGQFEAVRRVEVRARVSGELVKIHFTDGQTVKAGDILFTIDPRPFEIAGEAARAEVARARAQVAVTGNDLERAEQLTPSKVLTQRDFDQRKANHDAAKAQLQSAEAMLRNAELNLEWTSVPAPIDGRISDRKVDAGNLVSGGQVGASLLTTIVSLHPIHFVFNVSEPDYVRYSRLAANGQRPSSSMPGNAVQIRLADEKEWTRNGQMNFIDNQLNGKSGTIRARAVVENEDSFLTPGTFGRLRLFGSKVEALLIPDAAVVSDQSRKVIYAVGLDNKIQVKPVTLGPIEEGLRVVTTGLSKDDRVVISGLANPAVRSGAIVAPIPGNIVLATN